MYPSVISWQTVEWETMVADANRIAGLLVLGMVVNLLSQRARALDAVSRVSQLMEAPVASQDRESSGTACPSEHLGPIANENVKLPA